MKKMTTRFLSVILAALLVISSMPFVVLADEKIAVDEKTIEIEAAIEEYELKMDETIWTNMADAYDAYCEAEKALDAYVYGNLDIDLNSYAQTLREKINAMTQWQQPKAKSFSEVTSKGFDGDSGSTADYTNHGVQNVLYWTTSGGADELGSNEVGNVRVKITYPSNIVLLVDDSGNTPAFPVMARAYKNLGVGPNKDRYIYQLYPTKAMQDKSDNGDFALMDYWHASTTAGSDRTFDWTWTISLADGNSDYAGSPMAQAGEYNTNHRAAVSAKKKWTSMANVMKFAGTVSGYYQSYNSLSWYRLSGDGASDETYEDIQHPIHVINYTPLLQTMKETKIGHLALNDGMYEQGGLRDVLAAYDMATAIDPVNADYSNSGNVATIGNAIQAADSALSSATATADTTGYASLRKAIAAKKSIYEGGSQGYTEDSWSNFAQIYEEAVRIFADIQKTGYNSTTDEKATSKYAQDYADYLNAVELVTNVEKVDTTELEIAINEANDAITNKSFFTSESYAASNIETVAKDAKVAIWQAEENYPNARYKLDLSDENQAAVEAQYALVRAAIFALEIDKNVTVPTANNHSMTSVLEEATKYASEDYGNYADLASAVSAANNFITTVNNVSVDCIASKIQEYKDSVRAVYYAIITLRPAFAKITNGTWGSYTANASTLARSTKDSGDQHRWSLEFVRPNDVVVFRTQYEPFRIDFGGATLTFGSLSTNYDAHLDSINVYDVSEDNVIGEIVVGSESLAHWPAGSPVSIDQPDLYPGLLSVSTEQDSTYALKNLTVSETTASKLGLDLAGNDINDAGFIFDEILSATQGSSSDKITGTVTVHGGQAKINAEFTLAVPREAKKDLTAETLPTLTKHEVASNFGFVYFWKYNSALTYYGYGHDRVPYNQTTYVMNIAPLIELINRAKEIEGDEQQYTVESWTEFIAALSEANGDMDYGNMNATDIESACQTRYTNLWEKYNALVKCASNRSIHSALEDDAEVGNIYKADNADGTWSPARWQTFKEAYEAATSAIDSAGKYSDSNVRGYGVEEQGNIDEIATALTQAYNDLIKYGPRADFTELINAAKDTVMDEETSLPTHTLGNYIYTTESLKAIAEALADPAQFPYLNKSPEEKLAVYSEDEDIQAIAAEVQKAKALYQSTPVKAGSYSGDQFLPVDSAALEAAKATAKAQIQDPDAYGNIDEIKGLIDAADFSEPVTIFDDYSVQGVKYSTQDELNAAVNEILSGLQIKKYTVKVVDSQGAPVNATFEDEKGQPIDSDNGTISIEYGSRIKVTAPDSEKVDWFYYYTSNTSNTSTSEESIKSKYYTTDMWINFIVKGDTTLTVKSAQEESETVKITYVNALSGKTFAVDYVEKGQDYSLEKAPVLAYYDFLGYSVETESEDYVEQINPSEDTIIVANYEINVDAEYFTVTIGNLSGTITTTQAVSTSLNYNDLVEFTYGDGSNSYDTGGLHRSSNAGGVFKINGEQKTLTGRGTRYTGSDIYAWVIVKGDDIATWNSYRRNPGLNESDLMNIEKVVMYGDSYSFRVHENVLVVPYSKADFEEIVAKGYIETGDDNGGAVFAKENILNEQGGEKITLIGNFTLPADTDEKTYSFVEAGMLFKATTDGSMPAADLTLANAGTNGISRMKSSQRTVGNQFVISVNTSKLHNCTINAIYRAYAIYTDGTEEYIMYSNAVSDSVVMD